MIHQPQKFGHFGTATISIPIIPNHSHHSRRDALPRSNAKTFEDVSCAPGVSPVSRKLGDPGMTYSNSQWIGLRENLNRKHQETMFFFTIKYRGFL